MSKTKIKLRRQRLKLQRVVVPAEDLNKPASGNPLTGGLRGNCKWCGASIPLDMKPIEKPPQESATYKLEDLLRANQPEPESVSQPTHRLTGWCSICSLYGFDEAVDLSK